MQVSLVDGPVGRRRHALGVMLECPPEVREQPVRVVDGLDQPHAGAPVGPAEEHCARAKEGLDVVLDHAKPLPHLGCDGRLPTKIRKGCFHRLAPNKLG